MKISITRNKRLNKIFISIAVAGFWLLVWQVIYMIVKQEILVVSPFAVVKLLSELVQTVAFWENILFSMARILLGYLLGVTVGIIIAVLTFRFPVADRLLRPILTIIKTAPIVSFIILAIVWITRDLLPVFICFLMVVPFVWANVREGIENVDSKYLELAKVYRFSLPKKLRSIYIPSVMPYFTAAALTGVGLAWKAGIAAEVLNQPGFSIGLQLRNAQVYIETGELFAWTTVVILLSMLLEKALIMALNRLTLQYKLTGRK